MYIRLLRLSLRGVHMPVYNNNNTDNTEVVISISELSDHRDIS